MANELILQTSLAVYKAATSLEKAMAMDAPSISRVRKEHGAQIVHKLVGAHLGTLVNSLNITNTMSVEQIQEAAQIIEQEYWMLTVADLNAIFYQAKIGRFGEVYNRLDISIICKWIEGYLAKKSENTARMNDLLHDKFKNL